MCSYYVVLSARIVAAAAKVAAADLDDSWEETSVFTVGRKVLEASKVLFLLDFGFVMINRIPYQGKTEPLLLGYLLV